MREHPVSKYERNGCLVSRRINCSYGDHILTVREVRAGFSRRTALAIIAALGLGILAPGIACAEQQFPDVLSTKVRATSSGMFNFDVTISSPYDTPSRYADGFRVTTKDGEVLGERKLWHDHQSEQPFTRDLYSVKIPSNVKTVLVQARDQKYGYGRQIVEVGLPGR
ncbi:hypothetical protein [Sedimenticola hydrogenitrophicus]|uniref:hypothetical protein n=1 Tax=Sedimenticola hydrogenitrophicus TaxID=2967975 RepID=UPI0021A4E0C0|nr:hypothetical protein [Sedimenticola hydrogenitrophicus]